MPTIRHEPKTGSPPGYTAELSFSEEEVTQLAGIMGRQYADVAAPLGEDAAAIGRLWYTLEVSTPAELRAAFCAAATVADQLIEILRAFDPQSRRRLLSEYAGLGGEYGDGRKRMVSKAENRERVSEAQDLIEKLGDERAGAMRQAALEHFKADLTALARLSENLAIACKRVDVAPGRPTTGRVKQFAEKRLRKTYESFTEPLSPVGKEQRRSRRFLRVALKMLDGRMVQIPAKSPADSEMMSPGDTR